MTTYAVDRRRWQNLSIFEQMGNIYSEVGRSFTALRSNDDERAKAALARALDLFDATAEVLESEKSSNRLKELLRAKEQFSGAYLRRNDEDMASIEKYFMQFALAARIRN